MANEKHIYVTASGDYLDAENASEIWQVGLRFILAFNALPDPIGTLPNDWDPVAATISRVETNWTITGNWHPQVGVLTPFAVDDWLNDQVAPAFATWMAHNARSSKHRLRRLRAYPIGPAGKAIPAPPFAAASPIELAWTANYPVGSSASGLMPLQNSVVCSHRTAQIGRRGRGRMYVPAFTTPATAGSGRLDSSVATTTLNKQKALLEGVAWTSTVPPAEVQIAIWPIITGSGWTDYAVINQVQVGNVVDTQRRRRNKITEARIVASVAF